MNEQNNQNLLKKLFNKNLIKKASTIVLTAGVLIGGVSCGNTPDTTTTTQSQQQNNNNNQNQDISQYSQLLQNVLNDNYYNLLVSEIESGSKNIYCNGKYGAHPFAFLEDEGVDVDAIRAGTLPCYTMSYVLENEPNNLYIYSRVTYPNEGYSENYVVRYTLTDKEMKDYHLVNCGKGNSHFFIQAAFLNNEISETKTPTIVGTAKLKTTSFDKMSEDADRFKLYEDNIGSTLILLNPNKEDYTMELILIPKYVNDSQIHFTNKISHIKCLANIKEDEEIYRSPFNKDEYNIQQENIHNAKFYFPQDVLLSSLYCEDILDSNN